MVPDLLDYVVVQLCARGVAALGVVVGRVWWWRLGAHDEG
jgi:hypothetical protein